jgi:hypothetical protein
MKRLTALLHNFKGSQRPYRRPRRLWLEVLEDRMCPSGNAANVAAVSSLNPSVFGQPVTFTAMVAATTGSGTPTGSVTFLDGAVALGTQSLAATGAAT